MTATIVLVRHGPSVHAQNFGLLDRAAVQRWRDAYDAAGIMPSSRPPQSLSRIARDSTHVIASDLPRAVMSANLLAPMQNIRVIGLFREAPLAIPRWPTRLPLTGWGLVIHLNWMYQIMRGVDVAPVDQLRLAAATTWLTDIVADGSSALVVTHGVFRRMLGEQLVHRGWTRTGRRGGYRPWSAWSYSAPATNARR